MANYEAFLLASFPPIVLLNLVSSNYFAFGGQSGVLGKQIAQSP